MGSFANSVFCIMLGWVRSVAETIWFGLTGAEQSDFWTWFGNNWLKIFIVLCLVGLVIDIIVYLNRWQPYKVWKSFIRRHRKNEPDSESEVFSMERDAQDGNGEDTSQPVAAMDHDYEQESIGNTEKFSRAIQPGRRRRRSMSNLFNDGEEDSATPSPDSLINADEAYYQPVYPKNWKGSTGEQQKE